MGFNIAGLLIENKIEKQEIEKILECKITFLREVDFEEASSSYRDDDESIDILQTETGTLIITELGQVYDISIFDGKIIQFMISDVSDTYYFEKYINGNLERKYINSQGEIAENEGVGIIEEGNDMMDLIWELANNYLQNNFAENMFEKKVQKIQNLKNGNLPYHRKIITILASSKAVVFFVIHRPYSTLVKNQA